MAKRKLPNWLKSLSEYVEETEAPRSFWFWGGISTICSALQRKVWIPYGLENLYPNIYLLIVAKPGERKGGPPTLSKKLLEDIHVPVAVDSSSKRALTKELAETVKTEQFTYKGKPRPMAAISVISKEMSSLLAVDPKGIIEVLTDLFDSHDSWKYKTSGQGQDYLYNVCVNCFIVTTPTWLMRNLPEEAIGGGYTARQIVISQGERYKDVPIPPTPDKNLYKALKEDLNKINRIVGEFVWESEAVDFFDKWYRTLPKLSRQVKDERVINFLQRIHVMAIKVAMALRVSYSDELILTVEDIGRAVELLNSVVQGIPSAFGGHGASRLGPDTHKVMDQIKLLKNTTFKELLGANYRNLTKSDLQEVIETIEGMGRIKVAFHTDIQDYKIAWVKGKGVNDE